MARLLYWLVAAAAISAAAAVPAAARPAASALAVPVPRKVTRRPFRGAAAVPPPPPSPAFSPVEVPTPRKVTRRPSRLPANAYVSPLFGAGGELWNPAGRLADWGPAGYGGGTRAIPDYPAAFNVRDFGAQGLPGIDDSAAFQAAIDAAVAAAGPGDGKAVIIPPGLFTINQTISIGGSNVVLRGSGVGTILYVPVGLKAVYGTARGWAFSGGFVGIQGDSKTSKYARKLAWVNGASSRGDWRIYVNSTAAFQVGSWYKLGISQNPLAARRRSLQAAAAPAATAASSTLVTNLANMFNNSVLEAAAAAAAESKWDIVPPGTLAAAAGIPKPAAAAAAAAAAGAKPLPPLLLKAAEYAPALMYTHWLEDGDVPATVRPAMAAAGTIDAYLYGDNLVDSGTPSSMFPSSDRLRFPFRVTAVGEGYIDIDRPLPIDLRPAWTPVIIPFASTVTDSGLEHFTIQFKHDTYDTHLDDKGYNAIAVYETINSWVRHINIIDATNGVFMNGNEFATATNILISITAPRGTNDMATRGVHGHHAMQMAHGAYNLQTRFHVATRYYHDLSVDALLHLSVYSDCSGVDINADSHKGAVHNNLFTNINTGAGTRPWQSGGDAGRGADSGANATWWGIYSPSKQLGLPTASGALDCTFGPLLNWIGLFSSSVVNGACPSTKWHVDNIGTGRTLFPPDLFQAMRQYWNLLRD